MKIIGAASAFPSNYYPQRVLTAALQHHWSDHPKISEVLEKLHANSGVDGRYLARPIEEYTSLRGFGDCNRIWIEAAEQLGASALCRAVTRAGISSNDIGALIFVSVTGIASPSVDARIINSLKLSSATKRMPLFGLGCVAGAAGVSRAADYVRAFPSQVTALVSVECCSLTLQRDDHSVSNLISSGLFGDGAAAVLVAGENFDQPGPRVIATRSNLYPDTERVMGWDISEKGFQVVLSPDVPNVVREHLGHDVDSLLGEYGLRRADVGAWILHTGGPKVLEATQSALGIGRDAIATSWECLSATGNLSSASVLCVLEQFLINKQQAPGTWGILAAMGPGFCSELVLLRW